MPPYAESLENIADLAALEARHDELSAELARLETEVRASEIQDAQKGAQDLLSGKNKLGPADTSMAEKRRKIPALKLAIAKLHADIDALKRMVRACLHRRMLSVRKAFSDRHQAELEVRFAAAKDAIEAFELKAGTREAKRVCAMLLEHLNAPNRPFRQDPVKATIEALDYQSLQAPSWSAEDFLTAFREYKDDFEAQDSRQAAPADNVIQFSSAAANGKVPVAEDLRNLQAQPFPNPGAGKVS